MKFSHILVAMSLVALGSAGGCGGGTEGSVGAGQAFAGASGTATNGVGGGVNGVGGVLGKIGGAGAIAGTGPMLNCQVSGAQCTSNADCCSNSCNPMTQQCAPSLMECKGAGSPCGSSIECCTLSCTGGACSANACIQDGQACQTAAECCGGSCDANKCTALSTSCKTAGNACTVGSDCCSNLCNGGLCQIGASFCVQGRDVCGKNADCCSGICTIANGATLGSCSAPQAGSTRCGKVHGELCNGCGECCSRLCAPYGPTGVAICQPAQGCRINGELCREDRDCCGVAGTGLPGEGNVTCEKDAGAEFGRCRNPMGCNPQGNICHFKDYQCDNSTAPAQCCGDSNKKLEFCQLDALGIPRCNGLGECRKENETCATGLDCCTGQNLSCLPNASGDLACTKLTTPEACQVTGGGCTANADCCPGTICQLEIGASRGTCGVREVPPPVGSGGAPGAGGASSGAGGDPGAGSGGAPVCAEYGQSCLSAPCCNGVPCSGGLCVYIIR